MMRKFLLGAASALLAAFTVRAAEVADLDGVQYDSLEDAFKDAGDFSTITLLADQSVDLTVSSIPDEFTLDLNGFTLTETGTGHFINCSKAVTFTIQNGTFVGPKCLVTMTKGYLTLDNVTVTGGSSAPGINVGTDAEVNIKDCTFDGADRKKAGVYVNGGTATLENVKVTVATAGDDSALGAAVGVKGAGTVHIKSGTYQGHKYALAVAASQAGTIKVLDGTFKGGFLESNGKIELSGGTYDTDPSAYVAAGCEAVKGDFDWTIQQKAPDGVAKDDAGKFYDSLEAAFAGAASESTITLLKDCSVTSQITFNKTLTLNTNKKTIGFADADNRLFNISGGNFTLYGGGKITAKLGVFDWDSAGKLTVEGVTLETGYSGTTSYGNLFKKGTVNITWTTITSTAATGILADGSCQVELGSGNRVTVTGYIAELKNNPYASAAICLRNEGTVKVTGGYYESEGYGAYIFTSNGTFSMSDGEIVAGKCALQNDANVNEVRMTITGGRFTVKDTPWIVKNRNASAYISLRGGLYNVNPAENSYAGTTIVPTNVSKTDSFVADGYGVFEEVIDDVTWYRIKDEHVAAIGESRYKTLKDALEDVKEGETIAVLASCNLPAELMKIRHSFTLDLNGRAIAVQTVKGSVLSFEANDTAATVVVTNGVVSGGSMEDTCFIECNSSKGKVVLADLTATVACNAGKPDLGAYPAFVRSTAAGGVVEVVRCGFTATNTHKSPLLRTTNGGDFVVEDTTLDNSQATATSSFLGAAITIDNTSDACSITLRGDCRFSRASGTTGAVVYSNGGGDVQAEPGTYNFDPSAWVDTEKYLTTGPDKGIWTVEEKPYVEPVARIGQTEYVTLGDAVKAAKSGDTILLLKDVEITRTLAPTVSCTIDLGGKTVTAASTFKNSLFSVSGGQLTVTIKNGSVSMPYGGSSDTSLQFLFVEGITSNSSSADVTLECVTGTVFSVYGGAIMTTGSEAHLTIRNSSLSETPASNKPVLYAAASSGVDVIDSVLDASTQGRFWNDTDGSAVYLWYASLSVSGDSSVLKGIGATAISTKSPKTIVITGGTFSQDPTGKGWVDETKYTIVDNKDGTWTVKPSKVDPLPDPSEVTTPEKFAEVMADAADSLKANVTTVEEYAAFHQWVDANGIDHQTAKDSAGSFFSFATAQSEIVDTSVITEETVVLTEFMPTADGFRVTLSISASGLSVQKGAQPQNLRKVFGVKGGAELTALSPDNVDYTDPERNDDGTVSFLVTPIDAYKNAPAFFLQGTVVP